MRPTADARFKLQVWIGLDWIGCCIRWCSRQGTLSTVSRLGNLARVHVLGPISEVLVVVVVKLGVAKLQVSLQELYFGCTKKLRINRSVICTGCKVHEGGAVIPHVSVHSVEIPCVEKSGKVQNDSTALNCCKGCGAKESFAASAETLCKLCGGSGIRVFGRARPFPVMWFSP